MNICENCQLKLVNINKNICENCQLKLVHGNENIFEIIYGLISRKLNIPKNDIRNNSIIIDNLGGDSLDLYDICVEVEKKFDIELSDELVYEVRTVGDLADYIIRARDKGGKE